MCKAFSCLVTKEGKVYWQAGIDSHDELEKKFNLNPPLTPQYEPDDSKIFARIEIVPNNKKKHLYLYPDLAWKLQVDERVEPDWLTQNHKDLALVALKEWKSQIYTFDYEQARHPVNPLKGKPKTPTDADIELLKKWDSVRDSLGASVRDSVRDSVGASVGASVWASVLDSVWDSVWASVWASVRASVRDSVWASVLDSVWDSVWASVRAYYGSLFPGIKEWKYLKAQTKDYPYQPCVDLWLRGFVPSFDGKIWRLHSGKDAKIVYEMNK
jgi:hypothetical protein